MKFYKSLGPNPRVVRMFMAEKGIDVPFEEIDIFGAENRKPPYRDNNPAGQVPALELDDGTWLAETVAICEYLEDLNPEPPLIGTTPQEKAEHRMWQRRIELNITEHLYNGYRYSLGLEVFKGRIPCIPEAADGLKQRVQLELVWLDRLMNRKTFICGDRFTLTDIILYCALDFGEGAGQEMDTGLININAWFSHVHTRASAVASVHPEAAALGRRGL